MATLYQQPYYNTFNIAIPINRVNSYGNMFKIIPQPKAYTNLQYNLPKVQYINKQIISPYAIGNNKVLISSPSNNLYRLNALQITPNINQKLYQTASSNVNYKNERIPRFYVRPSQKILIPQNYLIEYRQKAPRANTVNIMPRLTNAPKMKEKYYFNLLNKNTSQNERKTISNNSRYYPINKITSKKPISGNDAQNIEVNNISLYAKVTKLNSDYNAENGNIDNSFSNEDLNYSENYAKVVKLNHNEISKNNGTEQNDNLNIYEEYENLDNIIENNQIDIGKSQKEALLMNNNTRNQFSYSTRLPKTTKNLNIGNNYFDNDSNNYDINDISQNIFSEKDNQVTEAQTQSQNITPFFKINGELVSNSNCKEYYRQTNTAPVTSYGYSQNQNKRNYMEDEGKVIENLNGDPNKILFCLFDGHGGGQVSKFLQENFGKYMKKILNYKNIISGFSQLFKKVDEDIKLLNCSNVGSTATIVYIVKSKDTNKRILYCVNVGDSRCVMVNKNAVYRLSYDDRVRDPKENERINKNGGIIVNNRIYGQLMLSRSFGDWRIKDVGVIVDPHVTKYEIKEDDLYCIIASDGIWDVIKDEECSILQNMYVNTGEMSKKIISECIKRKSLDNLSCFVISLQ